MLGQISTASLLPVVNQAAGLTSRLHPLAMEGYNKYQKGKKGFSAEDLAQLRESMVELSGDPMALWSAITGLGLLAVLLDDEGDNEAGDMIRQLIASGGQHLAPIAGEVSKALGLEPVEPIQDPSGARALSNDQPLRAAVHDAPQPAGTMRLYEVDYAMVSARFREVRLIQAPEWRKESPAK